jgi:hypothetical protein
MENMFYHIGGDLSKFPFMMYQIGTLKDVTIQRNLIITRTSSVNSGDNIFSYPIGDVSLLYNPDQ